MLKVVRGVLASLAATLMLFGTVALGGTAATAAEVTSQDAPVVHVAAAAGLQPGCYGFNVSSSSDSITMTCVGDRTIRWRCSNTGTLYFSQPVSFGAGYSTVWENVCAGSAYVKSAWWV